MSQNIGEMEAALESLRTRFRNLHQQGDSAAIRELIGEIDRLFMVLALYIQRNGGNHDTSLLLSALQDLRWEMVFAFVCINSTM